jgi:ABC-type phosphate transport system ATPase subunit
MTVQPKIAIRDFSFYYGKHQAIQSINVDIHANEIFSLFGRPTVAPQRCYGR